MNASPYQIDNYMSFPDMLPDQLTLMSLSVRMFLFCFYPLSYTLNVLISSRKTADVFSIATHVLCDLFLKICPLFGKILITCLKCSRVSFSLFSYSKKYELGRRLKKGSKLLLNRIVMIFIFNGWIDQKRYHYII